MLATSELAMRSPLVLTSWLGLAACQSLPEYAPPASGPIALVKFTTAGSKVGATVFDDERCAHPREVGTHERFVAVRADSEVYVQRGWYSESVAGTVRTNFTVAFTLEAGKSYELQYGQGYPESYLSLIPLDASGKWVMSDKPKIDPNSGKEVGKWPVLLPMRKFTCPQRRGG